MTRVCLLGSPDATLPGDLLAYETARQALSAYELDSPFADTVGFETVSLGAAVSMLNDLDWYLRRLVADAMVLEPSVSRSEWLSRGLATRIRNTQVPVGETGQFLKIYGVEERETGPPALVEPLFARRSGPEPPGYDLRDVTDTVVIRITPDEFDA